MKKLATIVALATFVASPAFAQKFAQPTHVVVVNGQVIGQDPDIAVRMELRRQAEYYLGRSGD